MMISSMTRLLTLVRRRGVHKGIITCNPFLAAIESNHLLVLKQHKQPRRNFSTDSNHNCWDCGKSIGCRKPHFFCPACSVIQPATLHTELSYFDTFSLDEEFKVDLRKLERKFWDLQKDLHPDKFGSKSESEKIHSADQSAHVNQGYQILKCPLRRAQYMLERKGIDALSEGGKTETDPMVLMEAMEARELLDECLDIEGLESMKNETRNQIHAINAELGERFHKNDLKGATNLAIKLRYKMTLIQEIEKKLFEIIS